MAAQPAYAQSAPKAVYSGEITGIAAKAGLQVRAEIDGHVCGTALTTVTNGVMRYSVEITPAAVDPACGGPGENILFFVDGAFGGGDSWRNGQTTLDLEVQGPPPTQPPPATATATRTPLRTPTMTPTRPPSTPSPVSPTAVASRTPTPRPGTATPTPDAGCRGPSHPAQGFAGCGSVALTYEEQVTERRTANIKMEAVLDSPEARAEVATVTGEAFDCNATPGRACRANRPLYGDMRARIVGAAELFPGAATPRPADTVRAGSWLWAWESDTSAPPGEYKLRAVLETAAGVSIAEFAVTMTVSEDAARGGDGGGNGMKLLAGGVIGLTGLGGAVVLLAFVVVPHARRAKSPDVFLSYRRGDAAGWTGRIHEHLARELGEEHVFQDIVDIEGGANWPLELQQRVAACDVLIALIGMRWVGDGPDGRRRIDQDDDWVRVETARALDRDCVVIPVFVDGMTMRQLGPLPADLSRLTQRNSIEITAVNFDPDMKRLLRAIRGARRRKQTPAAP
ncbi:hypothetical protein AYO38_10765 [bacterium SCGC AG-212-C10]|nr:hypothetical protein AYO38_10765 [bacterium SCGC AG-212-C10]